MADSDDRGSWLDSIAASGRDAAAERRDRAAEDRDIAAQLRDGVAAVDKRRPSSDQRELAARDRQEAAEDRKHAARDRDASSRELADAGIDSLTGVMRRGVGLTAVRRQMDRSERLGEPLVLAYVDTVGLKAINDSRGHAAGDRVLRDIAGCITADLRSSDLVTRVGGDEFVCTLSGQSVAQAGARYEKMSQCLAERPSGARMTVGLSALQAGDSLGELVDRADRAMIKIRR